MNMRVRQFLPCLLLALMLAGCGSPPKARSPRHEQAVAAGRIAQAAWRNGDYSSAASNFEEALRLDRSIENVDGIAINLLNLGRIYQAMGQQDEAEHRLDLLLQEGEIVFKPQYLGAAAIQKAQLGLRAGKVRNASEWLDRAVGYCAADCDFDGVIANLRASLSLLEGDAEAALHWGRRGIAENETDDEGDIARRIEHANSLRLTAQALLLKGDAAAAQALLEQALEKDKAMGLPERIRLDLLLLAEVAKATGRPELAGQYLGRAAKVSASSTAGEAR